MAEAPLLSSSEEVELGGKIQQLNEWEAVRNTLYEAAGGVVGVEVDAREGVQVGAFDAEAALALVLLELDPAREQRVQLLTADHVPRPGEHLLLHRRDGHAARAAAPRTAQWSVQRSAVRSAAQWSSQLGGV